MRIAGRSVSETLIDEPTLVQCGNVRLLIIPPRFANREEYAAHQVSSGTLADQTARLRNYPHVAASRAQHVANQENNSVDEIAALASQIFEDTKPLPAQQPAPALDLSPILSALAPIQSAIAETKDSLASLQSRVLESETRSESQENAQDLRPDLSQLIDRIDQRMGAFTNQCESLFSTVAQSLDSRFNHLGDLVQKLCESSLTNVEHASSQAILEDAPGEHRTNLEAPFRSEYGSSEVVSPLPLEDVATDESTSYEAETYQPTYAEPIDYKTEFEQSTAGYSTLEDTIAEQPAYEETFAEPSTFAEPFDYQAQYEAPVSEEEANPYQSYSYQELNHEAHLEAHQEAQADASVPESFVDPESDAEERLPSRSAKPQLPNWFTGYSDPSSDEQFEEDREQEYAAAGPEAAGYDPIAASQMSEELSVDQSVQWASARLNPIYAENTSSWLEQAGTLEESSLDKETLPSESDLDEQSAYEREPQSDDGFNGQAESFDYNTSLPFRAMEDASHEFGEASIDQTESYEQEGFDDHRPSVATGYDRSRESLDESSEGHSSLLGCDETAAEDSPEESIEDYMNRLLQRVKGGPASESSATVNAQPTRQTVRAIKPELPKVDIREESVEAKLGSHEYPMTDGASARESTHLETPVVRRAKPVEREENLSALRDLANATARSAIQKSSKKRLTIGITGKVSISLMGLFGGIFLLFVNGLNANILMLGMVCSFIIFLLWGYEAIEQTKQLAQQNVKDPKQKSETQATVEHRSAGDGAV